MMQQGQLQELKVSQFQNLQSVTSKATALNEVLRLIRYDSSVESKTVSYRKMMAVLGKAKADEELKQKQLPAVSVAVLPHFIRRRDNGIGHQCHSCMEMAA